jgi:hypothetical protein
MFYTEHTFLSNPKAILLSMSERRARGLAAWLALAAGGTSATLVIVLLLHTIRGPDADTVWPLVLTIGLSALVALAAAIPAFRHPRTRPIVFEGVELAVVSIAVLALLAFFFYVILGPGYS